MVDYVPGLNPLTPNKGLDLYSNEELRKVSADVTQFKSAHFVSWASVPDKYTKGDLFLFDAGVVGLVAGFYYWDGSKWVYVGKYPSARGSLYSNTTVALAVAVTDTLIDNYAQGSSAPVDVTQNPAGGTLTIQRDGVYLAQGFVDFINTAPNLTWEIVFYKNGVAAELTRTRLTAKDNNDGVNLNTIIVAQLVVGDVIDIRMKCSTAQNINIISKLLSMVQQ